MLYSEKNMNKDDPNYIVKVEKAIKDKYGQEAIDHPKKNWTKDKEEKYLNQLKEFRKKRSEQSEDREKTLYKGILVSKNLINKKSRQKCNCCGKYSFDTKDELYFSRYDACFECYIKYIEDREQRWIDGWRPPKGVK